MKPVSGPGVESLGKPAAADARLAVVIPVFNGWEQTRLCLQSLRGGTRSAIDVIVVEHGSTDATATELPRLFPEVHVVKGDASLWWSGATNLGVRAALDRNAGAVVLLNNDCTVEPGTLTALAAHHRRHPDAVISARQRDRDGHDQGVERCTSCLLLGFSTMFVPRWLGRRPDAEGLWHAGLIFGGRGALIPASVFARVGLFDEQALPHYGGDHDFYLRCAKAGVPLYVAADAWVTVDTSRTSLAQAAWPRTRAEFRRMLSDRRSHRNVAAQAALFRKHYPLPGLHWMGLSLFYLRYGALSALRAVRPRRTR